MLKETLKTIPILDMKPMPISTPKILWRDDDVNVYTDAFKFKELHQQFIDKNQIHTAAVLMKDLWENHALFWYLANAPLLEIGLHGWEHKDYSKLTYEECYKDIKKSLDYWKEKNAKMARNIKEIKTFFAPWNRESEEIRRVCRDTGLNFCNIKRGQWMGQEVKSFHWWNMIIDDWKL